VRAGKALPGRLDIRTQYVAMGILIERKTAFLAHRMIDYVFDSDFWRDKVSSVSDLMQRWDKIYSQYKKEGGKDK
jgi:hypothetical protein